MNEQITMIVPLGTKGRSIAVKLPPSTARWLWRQLGEALAERQPKLRRPVKLRRGRWVTNRRTGDA
jgi:hypothetical protein